MQITKRFFSILLYLTVVIAGGAASVQAQSNSEALWQDLPETAFSATGERFIHPTFYRTLLLDEPAMENWLAMAPMEYRGGPGLEFALPTPEGGFALFLIEESPVMEPELAARFPEIRTYSGRGVDDPTAYMRMDMTPQGFHAMVRAEKGIYFVDPVYHLQGEFYQSYYKRDLPAPDNLDFQCLFDLENPGIEEEPAALPRETRVPIEMELLNYRIAIACTGEYGIFHGGTVPLALAAIVVALNRVNMVYELDVAIRMNLVANNDLIVFLSPGTDPYTNGSPSALLTQNQATIDSVIGSANYDIGHVFSTGGGGLASLGVPCRAGLKARGETGLPQPVGDPFYIDFVAHEMGHQWGGLHTFNGSTLNCSGGNRSSTAAYEPGSGSTIMAYAGICGAENLQNTSDPYFHTFSIDQIFNYSRTGSGNACSVISPNANQAPVVEAGPPFTIPVQTPFILRGSATDPDLDPLTYCWEQFNLGTVSPPSTDNGSRPFIRSLNPVASPDRTIPRMQNLLNGTSTFGISLPLTNRTINFRLTVRDGNGGVDYDSVALTSTTSSGPFIVTSQTTAVTWSGTDTETVTWNVANTDMAPVSCANVDILLSSDGGMTFDTVLAAGVPNDGSQDIVVPNTIDTTTARIQVICSNNIFFNVNSSLFTVESSPLVCPIDFDTWSLPTSGAFTDSNGNGRVDIIDLLDCGLVP